MGISFLFPFAFCFPSFHTSGQTKNNNNNNNKKMLHKTLSMWLTNYWVYFWVLNLKKTFSSLSTPIAILSWDHLAELLLKVVDNQNRSAACTVSNKIAISSRPHIYSVEVLTDFYHCDLFYLFPITLCHFLGDCKLTFPVFQNFSHVEGIFSSYFTFTYLHFYDSMFVSIMIKWRG